jgi:hypothetical protein
MKSTTCRCGHPDVSTDPHPCHGKVNTCRKPATQYFYNPYPKGHLGSSLAGTQLKVSVADTWACETCWSEFKALLDAINR